MSLLEHEVIVWRFRQSITALRKDLDLLEATLDEVQPSQAHQPLHQVELWCDGGLHGPNPGSPLYGSYAFGDVKETVEFGVSGSNNEAEYLSLIAGLKAVTEAYDPVTVSLTVKTDSELVRLQVTGVWRVKAEHLKPLRDEARALLKGFASWKIEHAPRESVVKILGH